MPETTSSTDSPITDAKREKLDKKLKRFSEESRTMIYQYMEGQSDLFLPTINQILAKFAEKPSMLENPNPAMKLEGDEGIDSLSVVELSILVELIFNVTSDEFIEALSEAEESVSYGDVLKLCALRKVPGAAEACAKFGI
jgi:acyl carrier protein